VLRSVEWNWENIGNEAMAGARTAHDEGETRPSFHAKGKTLSRDRVSGIQCEPRELQGSFMRMTRAFNSSLPGSGLSSHANDSQYHSIVRGEKFGHGQFLGD